MGVLQTFQPASIQIKIALWAGLCLVIVSVVTTGYAAVALRNEAIEVAQERAVAVARSNALRINEHIEVARVAARTLAQSLEAVKDPDQPISLSRDDVNAMLHAVLKRNPEFVGVYTLWEPDAFDGADAQYVNAPGHDDTGRFIPYWSRGSAGSVMFEPLLDYEQAGPGDYYLCPKTTRRECIINPYIYPVQGEDMLITSLVAPIIVNNQFYGIAGIDVQLDFLQTLADQVDIYDGAGTLALISHNGILAGITGRPNLVGTSANPFLHNDDMERIRRGEQTVQFEAGHLEVFMPLQFGETVTPWSAYVFVPEATITADASNLAWLLVAASIGLTSLALGVLWVIAGQIARPIRVVTRTAQAVAEGRLDVAAEIDSRDETGVLAAAFNQMIANLRRMFETEREAKAIMQEALATQVSKERLEAVVNDYLVFVERVAAGDLSARLTLKATGDQPEDALDRLGRHLDGMARNLHQMTDQVRAAAGNIAAAAAEILAATTQQASAAAEQSAAITQTTTTIEEVKAIARQTAQQSSLVAQDSQTALQIAQQGARSVEATVGGMDQIKSRVESIAQTIIALAEQTQAIGAITATVSELADQSNLLALNAAIEAARAGEQGKSFAVVAQQVRVLAERSKAATRQVRDILTEIQRATNAAVLVTEDGARGVETGSRLASETGQVIHKIAVEVEQGAQSNVQMAAAAQQQMVGIDQVGQAITAIQQATTQSLASTRQAERAAQDLHSLAQSLQQTVGAYRL